MLSAVVCENFIRVLKLMLFSCGNNPSVRNTDNVSRQVSGSIAEEVRSLTETGVLSSMLQALETIRSRNLSTVDFGRMMNGINTYLIKLVYPDSLARLPVIDLPRTYKYTQIIRDAERGVYLRPPDNTIDFFEFILPFLAVANRSVAEIQALNVQPPDIFKDLERAAEIRPNSILPPFFRAMLHEQLYQLDEAERAYRQAFQISNECYSAQIGIARVRRIKGFTAEATEVFLELIIQYPDSIEIKRQLAICMFETRNWSRAMSMVDEVLQANPRDGEFLLIRASILVEQGNFSQANAALDSYAAINPTSRLYLFLRAKVQFEGNRNRDSALNYLRSILRNHPNDEEALIYIVTLLMDSPRAAEQAEGREFLQHLRRISGSSVGVLGLSLREAVMRENWQEAQGLLNRILAVRRTVQDLTDGYHIERNLGNNARAMSFARELYERDTSNHEYAAIYISALIDNGRRDEASRLLEVRINSLTRGPLLSRFYFLRSRLQTNDDAILRDLRSSLFEDTRNLDANIAMFEFYHRRREERRAVHYLRQALAIAPENPQLRRYEREYAHLLERN